jgi:hypothetical protein
MERIADPMREITSDQDAREAVTEYAESACASTPKRIYDVYSIYAFFLLIPNNRPSC